MQQLKYAWEDITGHKIRHFFLFMQIAAALVLFSFTISIIIDVISYREKLKKITEGQEIYLSRDMTEENRLVSEIMNAPDGLERLRILYSFIKQDLSFKTYTSDAQGLMWLPPDNGLARSFVVQSEGNYKGYNLLKIDQGFNNVFKLKSAEGALFSEEDFKATGQVIPLLLGYDFRKFYQLNDVISDTSNVRYRIIGFLEKSSFYLAPGKSDQIFLLDKWFIVPLRPKIITDYDSAINSTFIITDDHFDLQRIQQKSTELGLYTFEFRSFTEQMQNIKKVNDLQLKVIGLMLTVILIFSVIGLITNLVQFINTHTKEFAIHLLCGGRVASIIQRILIQIFLMIGASDMIIAAIHGISLVTLLTIGFSLLIGLIVTIYPAVKLSNTGINNLLRRSE